MAKKNLLFLIHGIGPHGEGWIDAEDGPVPALERAMKLYECFAPGARLRDHADVVEVRYNDIFQEQIQRWTDQVKDLPVGGPGTDWVARLQQLWARANGSGRTFTEYGGDLVLYRGFDLIARSVRLRVNEILLSEIYRRHRLSLESGETSPDITIVAHSMGTAVVYDALYSLFTGSWFAQGDEMSGLGSLTDEQRAHYTEMLARMKAEGAGFQVPVRLHALMMLSNTAGLLTRWDPADVNAVLKPGAATRFFYNVNHTLDPVGKVKPFRIPADWMKSRARDVAISHLHQPNVHAMGHYLANPAVNGRLFSALLADKGVFTEQCFARALALAKTPEWTGLGGEMAAKAQAESDRIREKLVEISSVGGDEDLFGLVRRFEALSRRVIGGEP